MPSAKYSCSGSPLRFSNGRTAFYDLGETPDALVIHLVGGELWVAFEDAAKMLDAMERLRRPLGTFYIRDRENPVAVYIIPKGRGVTALSR
jgi:hypothetical protein